VLQAVQFEGGDEDDRRFASAAFGLPINQAVSEAAFQQALAAVRLVDRYQSVEGVLGTDGVAHIHLVPLRPLASLSTEGAAPKDLPWSKLLTGLRRGQRVGQMRLKVALEEGERRLREAGFPDATLTATQAQGGAILRVHLALGTATLIKEVRIEGDPRPYDRALLLKVAGLEPGRSRWTPTALREAQRRLRLRLVKDNRLEGSARLAPAPGEEGVLVLQVQPGPKVKLKAEGMSWFGFLWNQPRLSELVPLARAERYAPSILEEGDGRISAYYRDQGYPEVKVTHARQVTSGTAERPESVTITYHVDPGPRRALGLVTFEGNREISEADLSAAAKLPARFLFLPPHAKAEVMKALEERITALYLQRGFPDVRVRRKVETAPNGRVQVRLIIWEGQQRFLEALDLELPADVALPRKAMARSLLLTLGEHPKAISGSSRFRSDRRQLQGVEGTLETTPQGAHLSFKPAIPLVRNDLALVVVDLRQKLGSAGALNPKVSLSLEEGEDRPSVKIQIPPQPLDTTKRLVVQGSDRTRAKAVLREMEAPPGTPLDPARLDAGQIRLGNLGAFQRVDLLSIKELPGQEAQPWQRGDLALRLLERSPWVFSESFGYDRTQGYHFGLGAQQLNVGGMGRTIDYGLRAGDQTLGIPALRRAFPTGDIKRSVDSYSVGYTDPWFLPSVLDSFLAERTRFHMEGAYIEEAQAAYFARRRRFTPSLEWKVGPVQSVQVGYRYERVEVAANTNSSGVPLISDADLFLIARTPGRSVISAPFLQVAVDRRDKPYDPTQGTFFLGRLELANQVFGTSINSSFVKVDLRHQWNWPMGFHAEYGVLMANVRLGAARPTAKSAQDLPLSERFYGGGSFTVRGVEPDMLGDIQRVDASGNPLAQPIPLGGQALAVVNLEYRFPLFGWSSVWMEFFVDSGQVYRSLMPDAGAVAPFPPFRTTVGAGLILKLGIPLKLEYAADWKRILGRPRSQNEQETQLKSLLISAGFQF
jgi:outer membrane protein assembly factor BamA